MFRFAIRTTGLFLFLSSLWACGTPPVRESASNANNSRPASAPQATTNPPPGAQVPAGTNPHAGAAGTLEFDAPKDWTSKTPSSSMRIAEYDVPPAEGDPPGTTLVVFSPMGGSVQDNIDRWIGQVQQPDGSSSKDKARIERLQVNGLNVTLLDLTGNYDGGNMSGSSGGIPNARVRNGVIETVKGNYFIRMVGPQKTVTKWDKEFMDFVRSARLK